MSTTTLDLTFGLRWAETGREYLLKDKVVIITTYFY